MRNLFFLLLFILCCNLFLQGQSVSISATHSTPDSSAILDIKSNSKGVLLPRMTSAQRLAIKNPAQGLLLFDTDLKVVFLFDSTKWAVLNQSPIATVVITVLDGNTCTIPNPTLSVAVGATVNIYSTPADITNNNPRYTRTTNASGIATFVVIDSAINNPFLLTVQKGSQKNIYNGYLLAGIFQSQSDIDSSPIQTPAGVVCGPKYADIDGDGRIDLNDQINWDGVELTKTVYIYQ